MTLFIAALIATFVKILVNNATLKASFKAVTTAGLAVMLCTLPSQASLFESLIPDGETYRIKAVDRDVAFLIDDYIYDAQKFCHMLTGDKVVFFAGQYGIDYRATVYNLDSNERCEVLLRKRFTLNN